MEKSLNAYLNDGWLFERMDGTLQALLLCAIYEITNTLDVDVKVLIQEYVDLAYAFFVKNEPEDGKCAAGSDCQGNAFYGKLIR